MHVFHDDADAGREVAMDDVDHKGVYAQGDEEPIGTYCFKNFETEKNGDIGDDETSKYDEYRVLRYAGEVEGAIAEDKQKEDDDVYKFYVFKQWGFRKDATQEKEGQMVKDLTNDGGGWCELYADGAYGSCEEEFHVYQRFHP